MSRVENLVEGVGNTDTMENPLKKDNISYADCWSPSERKTKRELEEIKGFLFSPFIHILAKLGVRANMASYVSALVGLVAAVFLGYNLKTAAILLIVSLLIDSIDGALARVTHTNNVKGSLTDGFADQIVISATTIGFIAINLLTPIIGGLYLVLYPIVIIFTILRNVLNIPRKYVLRPRLIVYGCFILYVFSSINILNYVVLPISIVLLLQMFFDFYSLRSFLSGQIWFAYSLML